MSSNIDTPTQKRAVSRGMAGRFALGIFLSALSGLMLLLSFPPYGLWPLVWVGFIPYLVAQYRHEREVGQEQDPLKQDWHSRFLILCRLDADEA